MTSPTTGIEQVELLAVMQAIALIDEINERSTSRVFHGIGQALHAKLCTIRATLARHRLASQSSSPVPEGWQPIETAPKDGSWFIAEQDGELFPCEWLERDEENTLGALVCSKGWFDHFSQSFEEPTHWRPLPDPPSMIEASSSSRGGGE